MLHLRIEKGFPSSEEADRLEKTFPKRIYELVSRIPLGKVATYGQLALLAGSPRAARIRFSQSSFRSALPPGALSGRYPMLRPSVRRERCPTKAFGTGRHPVSSRWKSGPALLFMGPYQWHNGIFVMFAALLNHCSHDTILLEVTKGGFT